MEIINFQTSQDITPYYATLYPAYSLPNNMMHDDVFHYIKLDRQ
jgi:hypothetical protein